MRRFIKLSKIEDWDDNKQCPTSILVDSAAIIGIYPGTLKTGVLLSGVVEVLEVGEAADEIIEMIHYSDPLDVIR